MDVVVAALRSEADGQAVEVRDIRGVADSVVARLSESLGSDGGTISGADGEVIRDSFHLDGKGYVLVGGEVERVFGTLWHASQQPAFQAVACSGCRREGHRSACLEVACAGDGGCSIREDSSRHIHHRGAVECLWVVGHRLVVAHIVLGEGEEGVAHVGLLGECGASADLVGASKAVSAVVFGVVETVAGDTRGVVGAAEGEEETVGGLFVQLEGTLGRYGVDGVLPAVGKHCIVAVEDDGGLCNDAVSGVAKGPFGLDGERDMALADMCLLVVDSQEAAVNLGGSESRQGVDR